MKRQFQTFAFAINNSAGDAVDIHIDGAIVDAETQQIWKEWFGDETSVSFRSFRSQLESVDAKVYNVYINSPGGLVTDAMAIHDLLIDMQSKGKTVNTIGRGIIASAATYILMAGSKPSMSKNSWFMIHNVSGGVWGDVNEIENYAVTLRKFNDSARNFYASFTGKRKEDIAKMMNAETWMTADEALENGFIKQVTGEVNFTNSIAKEHWNFSNTAVLNAYNAAVKPPVNSPANNFQNQIEEMKKFFQTLGNQILNAIKEIKAPENNDHAALMNSIGEAVNNAFSASADAIDQAIKDSLDSQMKDAVKNAVDEAIKPLTTKITNLETENQTLSSKSTDLENEIVNLKGSKTGAAGNPEAPKQVGSFNG